MNFSSTSQILDVCPFGKSTMYEQINEGLFPKPIKASNKKNTWLTIEVKAVLNTRIQGKSNEQIKEVVANLKAARGTPEHKALVAQYMGEDLC